MGNLLGLLGILGGGLAVLAGIGTNSFQLLAGGIVFTLGMLAAASVIVHLHSIGTTQKAALEELRNLRRDLDQRA